MKRLMVFAIGLAILFSTQTVFARNNRQTPMMMGDWNPIVGSGGVYQIEQKGRPAMTMEVAVVGKEADAFWVETRVTSPEMMISKVLVAPGTIKRTIVKSGNEPAMELPAMSAPPAPNTRVKETAQFIGKEQVTTPAGTFSCDHYRSEDLSGPVDIWVATKISPYGLIKMSSKDTTMVLSKTLSGEKSRITETPQKIEMPSMPNIADLMKQSQQGDDR